MRIIILAVTSLCLGTSLAFAEDISPWFGSADQKPFRVEFVISGAMSSDQTITNSTTPADCEIAGCPADGKTANTNEGQVGLSQN